MLVGVAPAIWPGMQPNALGRPIKDVLLSSRNLKW
jgi:hypothetical protein